MRVAIATFPVDRSWLRRPRGTRGVTTSATLAALTAVSCGPTPIAWLDVASAAVERKEPPVRVRSSLIGHTAVYASGLALQGLGGLLVLPFITRALGPGEYGRVAVAVVVMMLVGLLVSGGAQLVLLAEYYRDADGLGARALAGAVVTASAVVAVVALIVLAALPVGSWATMPVLSVLAAGGLASVSTEQAMFRAMQRPGRFLAVTLASTVGAQLAGLLGALGSGTAESYMAAYAAMVGLSAVVGATGCRLVRPWRHTNQITSRVRLLAPVVPQTFALLALVAGDVLLVAWVLGDAAAGRYQVAWLLGSVAYYSASAVSNAWSPRAMDDASRSGGWGYLTRTGGPVLAAVASVGVAVVVASPLVLPILAPADFDPNDLVSVVAVLVLSGPAALLYLGSANVLLRAKRTPALLMLTAAGTTTMAVLALALMPQTGIVGAALGKVAGLLVLGLGAAWAASSDAGPLLRSWRATLTVAGGALASLAYAQMVADPSPLPDVAAFSVLVASVVVVTTPLVRTLVPRPRP
jgi:O-antigen/teichoic acid export membrane protein